MRTRELPWVKRLLEGQPPGIRFEVIHQLANVRAKLGAHQRRAFAAYDFEMGPLESAFEWATSDNGHNYWSDINLGIFDHVVVGAAPMPEEEQIVDKYAQYRGKRLFNWLVAKFPKYLDEVLLNLEICVNVKWDSEDLDKAIIWLQQPQGFYYWRDLYYNHDDSIPSTSFKFVGTHLFESCIRGCKDPAIGLLIRLELMKVAHPVVGAVLSQSFIFEDTPQGGAYWRDIAAGNYLNV